MPDDVAAGPRIERPTMLALAIIVGIFEAVDLASVGLTLSRLSHDLDLDAAQGGICASASMLGLTIGAAIGGRLADIHGRKRMMLASMLLLGLCATGTAFAWDFTSLLTLRLLTGLGMGGLMPILIAIAGDAAAPRFRSTAISMLMGSGGLGGMIAGFVALAPDWRWVYFVGGLGPLLMIPAVIRWLPAGGGASHEGEPGGSMTKGLFGEGRGGGTLLVWVVAFATTLASYVLINWLPSLLVRQGLDESASHSAMIVYSFGGIIGNLAAGVAMDRNLPRLTYAAGYLGASFCALGLAAGVHGGGLYALAFGLNFFTLGAQLATMALVAVYYPPHMRATGLGALVSAGRLGSVVGPLTVGQLLHGGLAASQVLLGLVPVYMIALVLALFFAGIVRRRAEPQISVPRNFTE